VFTCVPVFMYTTFMPQYFTLQQANETLGIIRPLMEEVQKIRRKILANQPEAWPAIEKSAGNGGNRALSKMVQDFEKLDTLVHQIQDTGAQVKDINTGLLDFSALKEGREVYLCWQHGEGEIAFWHEVEAGYAGRQSIETF
jgi:hypothetical protein